MTEQNPLRLSLVGLPGSGKTTVGRQLARRLNLPFLDSDQVIEQRLDCSIRDYFATEGEERFRDVEQQVRVHAEHLADRECSSFDSTGAKLLASWSPPGGQSINLAASSPTQLLLSTGGGVVLRSANRAHLRDRTHVVYLRSSPEELFRRLRHDQSRPLLQVADPLQRLRDLNEVRDPLYRETAHFVVETGRPSLATLVNMVVIQLELSGLV